MPTGRGRSSATRWPRRRRRCLRRSTAGCLAPPIGSTVRDAFAPIRGLGKRSPRNMPLWTSWRGWSRRSASPGNRERFSYWLDTFRYLRLNGQVNCTWARYNEAMKQVKAEKDPSRPEPARSPTRPADPQGTGRPDGGTAQAPAGHGHHDRRDGHRDKLAEHHSAAPADRAGRGVGQDAG